MQGRFSSGRKGVRMMPAQTDIGRQSRPLSSRFHLISSLLGDFESMRMISKLPENHPYG